MDFLFLVLLLIIADMGIWFRYRNSTKAITRIIIMLLIDIFIIYGMINSK
jgi:hypothetical protein